MAASHVSGMKMRTLLFGVILGLLTVVHSTPVHNVTQIPAKAEDEVIREAATDGFLVENASLPSGTAGSPTTGSPATNSTVQASQLPTAIPNEGVAIEGSDGETSNEATTAVSLQFGATTAPHAPSSASTMIPEEIGESSSVSYAAQSPPSSSTPVPNEAQPSATPDRISASQTTSGFLGAQGSDSGSGSGDGEMFGPYFTTATRSSMTSSASPTSASPTSASPTSASPTSASPTSASPTSASPTSASPSSASPTSASPSSASPTSASPTSATRPKVQVVFPGSDESGSGEGEGLKVEVPIVPITTGRINQQRRINEPIGKVDEALPIKGEGTPGWMIIVGFIVGLAALVMIFVAIATRDKWNGPPRASMLVEKTNASNQQREVEMKTFLQKDEPKENGHGSEYTVIPLEELPEKYLSH